jgi:hypothetical protein
VSLFEQKEKEPPDEEVGEGFFEASGWSRMRWYRAAAPILPRSRMEKC